MPPEENKVDRLSQDLYSRTRYKDPLDTRAQVKPTETPQVAESFQGGSLDELLTRERKDNAGTPFVKKFFIFAILFFLATLVVAGVVFFSGSSFISSKNLDIQVVGPTNAGSGQVTELEVTVENGNNADLDTATFSIQYPAGTRDPNDSSKELTYSREDLGVMKAGSQTVRNVRFFLVGAAGEVKTLKFSVEYKVKGSNATFYKDKSYDLTIGNSPLSISLAGPDSVDSGQEFTTTASVTLNSSEVLRNVMLKAEYPYGFSVTGSSPQPYSEDNLWSLGDLAPGATKKIQITGKLSGENGDERTIRLYAGSAEGTNPSATFSTVVSTQKTVAINRPAVDFQLSLNGETGDTYVAPAGSAISAILTFKNNLPAKLTNPVITVSLSGATLDTASVAAFSNGFYNQSAHTLTWELGGTQSGTSLDPGESGSVSFKFASLKDLSQVKGVRDISLSASLTGTPLGSSDPVTVSDAAKVKIASQVTLGTKALYSVGAFKNAGPLPPKAEATTTYTIAWTLGNTQNDVSGAKVTAQLGSGVTWLGAYSKGSEDISYDASSNTVTWNAGTLASGTGFTGALREADFQVSLLPTSSQVGTKPTLVSSVTFSGLDSGTQSTVTLNGGSQNTTLSNDPKFIQGDDIVVK